MIKIAPPLFALASVFVASCASAPAPTPPTPATPAPSAAGECTATLVPDRTSTRAGRKADAWTQVGTLVVTLRDAKPVSVELIDGASKSVGTTDAGASAQANRDVLRAQACRVGGALVVTDGEPPATGTFTLRVLKPIAPDEAWDLKTMCSGPPPVLAEVNAPSEHRGILALEVYEATLTSPKWRAFVLGLHNDVRKANDDAGRIAARRARARELPADCWFAGVLDR